MSTKTNAEMLKSLRQYNKTAREVKAKKEGFTSSTTMIAYLEGCINSGQGNAVYGAPATGTAPKSSPKKEKQVKAVIGKTRPTIHVIDILDSSGSMSGGKHQNALKGINLGVAQLRQDVAEVDYTYTLCDFSDDIRLVWVTAALDSVGNFTSRTRNATALYDAIGDTVNAVRNTVRAGDKVLVNVYTDGQENTSKRFKANQIASIIDELSQVGWTFTFIGTAGDVAYAQRNLKFDASNTLVHDNTGAGMEKAFTTNSVSRAS
jgi:hypothetical protein